MIKRYLIYLFAFSNFCIQISSQEITYNQEFKVNTHRNWYNYNPCISGLAEANFVICWRNDGQDGSEEGIYGQLFSASAQRLGNEFKVSAYSESQQMNPCITDLSDKNILVCWEHGDLIYGRLCSSSGAHIGDEFQVNKTNRSYQGNPCAARLTADSQGAGLQDPGLPPKQKAGETWIGERKQSPPPLDGVGVSSTLARQNVNAVLASCLPCSPVSCQGV